MKHASRFFVCAACAVCFGLCSVFSAPGDAYSLAIEREKPSWVAVPGGNILCQPLRTSYGSVAVCDGKLVCAISPSGKVLWQRGFMGKMQPFISRAPSDLLYVVTKSSVLAMLNPGGLVLWETDTRFTITEAPLSGRDGRVFVRGSNFIACYGIHGVQRWKRSVDSQHTSLPLLELNDGSLLAPLSRTDGGKTMAIRLSPFGVPLETITFSGTVKSARSCVDGVVLLFSDGSIGLVAAEGEMAVSRWILQSSRSPARDGSATLCTDGMKEGTVMVVSGNPARIAVLSTADGTTLSAIETQGLNAREITYAGSTVQGMVVCDKTKGLCYKMDGTLVWQASFGGSKLWNYVFPTDNGMLNFCMGNWAIEAYRIRQDVLDSARSFIEARIRAYRDFYTQPFTPSTSLLGPTITPATAQAMRRGFSTGAVVENDGEWLPLVSGELKELAYAWQQENADTTAEKPYHRTHVAYSELVISLAAQTGVALYHKDIANLMKIVEDPSLRIRLLRSAAAISYDPDGDMLFAIDYLLQTATTPRDTAMLREICSATFAICRFMGRPAFFERGQGILARLIQPQYDRATREYARATLRRFVEIRL